MILEIILFINTTWPPYTYTVEFEIVTSVVMKSSVLWDTTPCSPLRVNRRFGGTYSIHLQGRRKSSKRVAWSRLRAEPGVKELDVLVSWRYRRHVLRNVCWPSLFIYCCCFQTGAVASLLSVQSVVTLLLGPASCQVVILPNCQRYLIIYLGIYVKLATSIRTPCNYIENYDSEM
jgi:hypothetical protein